MSEKFPYLAMSRTHGVDYGDVLKMADALTYPEDADKERKAIEVRERLTVELPFSRFQSLSLDVYLSVRDFHRIRREGWGEQ